MGTREIPGLYKAKEGESLRILLTGGAGFQGTHLAEKWVKGVHKVTLFNILTEVAPEI